MPAITVQIRVSDMGHGIGSEFLPFIFDRFRQADGTTSRQHGGLGLGLAIVRHLVELHGGTIKAPQDTTGRKKTIGHMRTKEASNGRFTSLPSLDGVKVLLVDDDPDMLQMLSVMLGESKATVETANSVSVALEVLEWYQPDVLVSDLVMPREEWLPASICLCQSRSSLHELISAIANLAEFPV